MGISHIAQLLNQSEAPWYGVAWEIIFETPKHFSGVNWCNLATPIALPTITGHEAQPAAVPGSSTIVPANMLYSIKRINGVGDPDVPTVFSSNFVKMDLSIIMTLANNLNDQYRQTIGWAHHGSALYFHVGADIGGLASYYEMPDANVLWGYRRPLLDNLKAEPDPTSSWSKLVDLPDSDMRLLLLLVQKKILEQVNQQPDQAHIAEIQQLTAQITGNLVQEVQMEKAEREKNRYGLQGR